MILSREFNDFPAVYKSFDDIPDDYKLANFEEIVTGDVWGEYLDEMYFQQGYDKNDEFIEVITRAGDGWKSVCQEHHRHHALATPRIVDDWCKQLLKRMSQFSARKNYISYINQFYRYLKWNVDYPHIYNPVQFAVIMSETTEKIWESFDSYYGGDSNA